MKKIEDYDELKKKYDTNKQYIAGFTHSDKEKNQLINEIKSEHVKVRNNLF